MPDAVFAGTSLWIHPAVLLCLGALAMLFLPRGLRVGVGVALPLASLAGCLWAASGEASTSIEVLGWTLEPFRLDGLALPWVIAFHLAASLVALYGAHRDHRIEDAAALAYAGSALGAVLAGDWITLFLWWEMTALTSVVLLWGKVPGRLGVAQRYLLQQVASGLLLIGGLSLRGFSDLRFGAVDPAGPGSLLLLLAFGIKAGFPLLHTWIKEAYPAASVTGTVCLSVFTTKLAIYALARGFAGYDPLILVGVAMGLFTLVFMARERDLRRLLAYALINQLGLMVAAVGLGDAEALNGVAAHAMAHIFYKSLLFMAAGALLVSAGHAPKVSGALASRAFAGLVVLGVLAMGAFPGATAFVSKKLLFGAFAHHQDPVVYATLTVASVAAFALVAAAFLPAVVAFVRARRTLPVSMLLAMVLAAAGCVLPGVMPGLLGAVLPHEMDVAKLFTVAACLEQVQGLAAAGLALTVAALVGWNVAAPGGLRDADVLVRAVGGPLWEGSVAVLARARLYAGFVLKTGGLGGFRRLAEGLGPYGRLARSQGASSMTFWVAVMLALVLLFNYL